MRRASSFFGFRSDTLLSQRFTFKRYRDVNVITRESDLFLFYDCDLLDPLYFSFTRTISNKNIYFVPYIDVLPFHKYIPATESSTRRFEEH